MIYILSSIHMLKIWRIIILKRKNKRELRDKSYKMRGIEFKKLMKCLKMKNKEEFWKVIRLEQRKISQNTILQKLVQLKPLIYRSNWRIVGKVIDFLNKRLWLISSWIVNKNWMIVILILGSILRQLILRLRIWVKIMGMVIQHLNIMLSLIIEIDQIKIALQNLICKI